MLKIDKNGETCGRQIDSIVSGFNMKIFGEFLIFEIPGSRYPKIAIFEGFGEGSQLQN